MSDHSLSLFARPLVVYHPKYPSPSKDPFLRTTVYHVSWLLTSRPMDHVQDLSSHPRLPLVGEPKYLGSGVSFSISTFFWSRRGVHHSLLFVTRTAPGPFLEDLYVQGPGLSRYIAQSRVWPLEKLQKSKSNSSVRFNKEGSGRIMYRLGQKVNESSLGTFSRNWDGNYGV